MGIVNKSIWNWIKLINHITLQVPLYRICTISKNRTFNLQTRHPDSSSFSRHNGGCSDNPLQLSIHLSVPSRRTTRIVTSQVSSHVKTWLCAPFA